MPLDLDATYTAGEHTLNRMGDYRTALSGDEWRLSMALRDFRVAKAAGDDARRTAAAERIWAEVRVISAEVLPAEF